MKQLSPSDYPIDFYYHRTSSDTYRKYLESCWPKTFDINTPQFAWKKLFFGWTYCVSRFERTDIEPDIEVFKKEWIKHGMITWIPYRISDKPEWWRRLYLTEHFQNTGYTTLDDGDYKKHWNDRAKRAQKKFLASGDEIRSASASDFIDAFRKTKVKHPYRSEYISYYKKISAIDPESVRQWIVYHNGTPTAWLAVLDYIGNHSVHLVAFTGKQAYDTQWWTWLIDEWFRTSQEKWIKYLTFDQLRNPHGPKDQKGYTEFKENFIEHKLSFPKAYFKVF